MRDILIPSIIGLTGVIIGSIITSIYSLKIKSKETKLRIIEKIFDKRIQSHENILLLIVKIRSVISTETADENNNLVAYPSSMSSKENFNKFFNEVFLVFHQNAHWLNTDLEREFWFFQDYLISLNDIIKKSNDINLSSIGIIVKQDFIDIASKLENITFDFFRKDIYEMKINKHDKWHKYPREITFERINKTNLICRRSQIKKIINN